MGRRCIESASRPRAPASSKSRSLLADLVPEGLQRERDHHQTSRLSPFFATGSLHRCLCSGLFLRPLHRRFFNLSKFGRCVLFGRLCCDRCLPLEFDDVFQKGCSLVLVRFRPLLLLVCAHGPPICGDLPEKLDRVRGVFGQFVVAGLHEHFESASTQHRLLLLRGAILLLSFCVPLLPLLVRHGVPRCGGCNLPPVLNRAKVLVKDMPSRSTSAHRQRKAPMCQKVAINDCQGQRKQNKVATPPSRQVQHQAGSVLTCSTVHAIC
mmetsp:Transcript_105645/g.340506  ORF Transcript_105645/g.340506 Transcript_105645/m.340506 type:complete len:266 (-) Transcript_105645:49-846(-)